MTTDPLNLGAKGIADGPTYLRLKARADRDGPGSEAALAFQRRFNESTIEQSRNWHQPPGNFDPFAGATQ